MSPSQCMRRRFARAVLAGQATILLALGLAYLVRPQETANLGGILLMEGGSVGLVRAWLGILPLALGALLLQAQRTVEWRGPALIVVAVTSSALLLTRLVSWGLEPVAPAGFDLFCLLWWLLAAALATLGWRLQRERPEDDLAPPPPLPQEPPRPFRRGDSQPPASSGDPAVVAFRRSEPASPAR